MIKTKEIKTKEITLTEKGFNLLKRDFFSAIRLGLLGLYHCKAITQKEKSYLEFEFDKIIYKIDGRGGQ